MIFKKELKKILWKLGYDLSRINPYKDPQTQKKMLFDSYAIDVFLDVGANEGSFAQDLRNNFGFSGKIISFEPLSTAFKQLSIKSTNDPKWKVMNCALGETNTKSHINISSNSYSSSLRNILPIHIKAAPQSSYFASELIEIKTLDSIFNNICSTEENIFLKIDTQGYESNVINGANESISRIGTIELEMSLIPLYEGQLLFPEMHDVLSKKGYCLVSIETEFIDPHNGQILQINCTYHRF